MSCRSTRTPRRRPRAPWFAEGAEDRLHLRPGYNKDEHRWGNGLARILDVAVVAGGEADRVAVDAQAEVTLLAKAQFLATVERPVFGMLIKTVEGVLVYGVNSRTDTERSESARQAGEVMVFSFTFPAALAQGNYLLSMGIASDPGTGDYVPLDRRYDVLLLKVLNRRALWGLVDLDARFGTAP